MTPIAVATAASSSGSKRSLLVGANRAEQHLGVAERLLHRGERVGLVHLERVELVGHRRRVGPERADVVAARAAQMVGEVSIGEQREPGQLVGEHPQPHLVERDRPLVGERVDRRGNEHERGRGPRDRQVVDAERPAGERADHRADAHPEHRRRHHLAEPGHHLGHRVGGDVGGRSSAGPSDDAISVNSGRYASSVCCAHCSGVATSGSMSGTSRPHHVGDVQAGDVGEFGVLDAHRRVDVGGRHGRGRRPGTISPPLADEQRELSRRVPVERALTGERPREITEQRQPVERVDVVAGAVVVGHLRCYVHPAEIGSGPWSPATAYRAAMTGVSAMTTAVAHRRRRTARAAGGRALALEDDSEVVVIDSIATRSERRAGGGLDRAADVVIDLARSDYDRRATIVRARPSSPPPPRAADRLSADQVVFVSSAMVYGALRTTRCR